MADTKSRSGAAIAIAVIVVVLALVVGLLWLCGCLGGGTRIRGERTATILAVNDIYRIDGVGDEQIGGLHRLRTLRKTIEKESGNVLLLHAGDFLSPSLESRVFKGEQMIDAMNNLDGDPKKFDTRMFVAFGNHEFDDSDCNKSPAPLMARLDESQFTWLNVNLDFSNCPSMKDVPAHKNVKRTAVVELNGIKFGIFGLGLTPDIKNNKKHPSFGELYESARAAIKELRAKKADVVVALTHLNREDDQYLIDALSGSGLDLLVGGHDHTWMVLKDNGGVARGYKADSDAKSAWIIKVRVTPKGKGEPKVEAQAEPRDQPVALDGKEKRTQPDPEIDKLAKNWWDQAQAKFCAERKKAGRPEHGSGCLEKRAGTTAIPISLEEANNRNSETKFGQWIAGVLKRETGADVAIVNSGILGLNTNLRAESQLKYKHILDIFRYDNVIAVRTVPAKDVCDALRLGFSKPGTGAWPHVAGIVAPDLTRDEPKLDDPPTIKQEAVRVEAKWIKALAEFDKCKPENQKTDDIPTLKVVSVPYAMCGGDDYPFLAEKDEIKGSNRNEQVTTCMAALTKEPIKGGGSVLMSVLAEDAIRADEGIKLPLPTEKRTLRDK